MIDFILDFILWLDRKLRGHFEGIVRIFSKKTNLRLFLTSEQFVDVYGISWIEFHDRVENPETLEKTTWWIARDWMGKSICEARACDILCQARIGVFIKSEIRNIFSIKQKGHSVTQAGPFPGEGGKHFS